MIMLLKLIAIMEVISCMAFSGQTLLPTWVRCCKQQRFRWHFILFLLNIQI